MAATLSARQGSVPVKLPLEDRSLTLYPRPNRWLGGDEVDSARRNILVYERN